MVIMSLDFDVAHSGTWYFSVKIKVPLVFLQVETWDEAIHESMATREMAIKFIEIVHWTSISMAIAGILEDAVGGVEYYQKEALTYKLD